MSSVRRLFGEGSDRESRQKAYDEAHARMIADLLFKMSVDGQFDVPGGRPLIHPEWLQEAEDLAVKILDVAFGDLQDLSGTELRPSIVLASTVITRERDRAHAGTLFPTDCRKTVRVRRGEM